MREKIVWVQQILIEVTNRRWELILLKSFLIYMSFIFNFITSIMWVGDDFDHLPQAFGKHKVKINNLIISI